MKVNFWGKLKKEKKVFFALAPMSDVTDSAFRKIIAKYGKPDILFTEFVSCDGLCSVGREKLMPLLKYDKTERPIVAQLFGSVPENFEKSASLVKDLGFDGIDINMGCPQKNIIKQGSGSKLITQPKLAQEIIRATKKGAGDLPVSVKTRIGYKENEIENWLPFLLEEKPVAITIHGRTQKEMSKVPAHWDIIKRGVEIAKGSGVLILGNGDIKSLVEGRIKAKETGVDGIMIGRGIYGNPFLFNEEKQKTSEQEKLLVLIEHLSFFKEIFKKEKSFNLMKKHIGAYVKGFKGAKELRINLMESQNPDQAIKIIKNYLKSSPQE